MNKDNEHNLDEYGNIFWLDIIIEISAHRWRAAPGNCRVIIWRGAEMVGIMWCFLYSVLILYFVFFILYPVF